MKVVLELAGWFWYIKMKKIRSPHDEDDVIHAAAREPGRFNRWEEQYVIEMAWATHSSQQGPKYTHCQVNKVNLCPRSTVHVPDSGFLFLYGADYALVILPIQFVILSLFRYKYLTYQSYECHIV